MLPADELPVYSQFSVGSVGVWTCLFVSVVSFTFPYRDASHLYVVYSLLNEVIC